ncbi:hypothetical protein, partial [Gordonia sp. NPDC058843]|uniref:hypothetical protein n=1 Tax=Gordonia sp. NPDC058843 TaxID=3346648 RepID=UPI0036808C41
QTLHEKMQKPNQPQRAGVSTQMFQPGKQNLTKIILKIELASKINSSASRDKKSRDTSSKQII